MDEQGTQQREAQSTYFRGRLGADELRKLQEVADLYQTTSAKAMRIILRAVQVKEPVITFRAGSGLS